MPVESQKQMETKQAPPIEIEEREPKYHVIKLHGKRHEHDIEVPTVTVNGERLTMRRDTLIPVPDYICAALDEATYPQYRMPTDEELLAGRKEKIVGWIKRFSYDTVFRDIPKDVYLSLRRRATDPNAKPITEPEITAMLNKRKN